MFMDYQMAGEQTITAETIPAMHDVQEACEIQSYKIRDFELSGSVWAAIFTSYAVFFAVLIVAIGHDAPAYFVLVISMFYTIMYFVTAAILNGASAVEQTTLPPVASTAP